MSWGNLNGTPLHSRSAQIFQNATSTFRYQGSRDLRGMEFTNESNQCKTRERTFWFFGCTHHTAFSFTLEYCPAEDLDIQRMTRSRRNETKGISRLQLSPALDPSPIIATEHNHPLSRAQRHSRMAHASEISRTSCRNSNDKNDGIPPENVELEHCA